MKTIHLTQGQITFVDDEDYDYLNQWKWYAKRCNNLYYAGRNVVLKNEKHTSILMHKVILPTSNGKIQVDHIDRNGLNNQKYNLRKATNTQNAINSIHWNSSKYRGVHFNKRINKYQVHISVNGRKKSLGTFIDPIIAAKKYDKYALKYHGEFAIINFK